MQIFKWVPVRLEEQIKQQQQPKQEPESNSINQFQPINGKSCEISETKNSFSSSVNETKSDQEQSSMTTTTTTTTTDNDADTNKESSISKTKTTFANGCKQENISLDSSNSGIISDSNGTQSNTGKDSLFTPIIAQPISSGVVAPETGTSDNAVLEDLSKVDRTVLASEKENADNQEGAKTTEPNDKKPEPPSKSDSPEVAEKRKHDKVDDQSTSDEPPTKQVKTVDANSADNKVGADKKAETATESAAVEGERPNSALETEADKSNKTVDAAAATIAK